jgi:ubiquinone/menaquinone biosynthesis C-methylase UbiE
LYIVHEFFKSISMFLSRRTTQEEYFDSERSQPELRQFFVSLGRLNRLFVFAEPFQRSLPKLLAEAELRSLSVLDLGAGDGSLGETLTHWAAGRGWRWRITNLDLCPAALRLGRSGTNVAGSALALPFRDGSFDLVIASQMTHHLTDGQAKQHFREAWRVARRALFVSDLHRNALLYSTLWLLFRLQDHPEKVCSDGLLSVKRSWRVPEFRRLAEEAGIEKPQVQLYFGARILLHARKQ